MSEHRPQSEAEEREFAERPEGFLRRREFLTRTAALAGLGGLATILPPDTLMSAAARVQSKALGGLPSPRNMPLDTVVVLMMENRSYDHYFGWYDRGDGDNQITYPDGNGGFVKTHRLAPDYQGCGFDDPNHSWDGGRVQYDNGALDGFVIASDSYAAGYYLGRDIPFVPKAAKAFQLYDRYFASLLGPTWPNREYMHSAQSGGLKSNAKPEDIPPAYFTGGLYKWETIWDRLLQAGVSCGYYFSDLPFISIFGSRYLPITKPIEQYYVDAATGRLPHVVFLDPPFLDGGGGHGLSGDEHPHGDIRIGEAFMSAVTHAFMDSPHWKRGAMFINYDEWGGFFEHVSPPVVPDDRESSDLEENFGQTGFRVPGVAVSPFAPRHSVSHMQVTHESILKLISYRFGLGNLNKRMKYASNIGESLNFFHPNYAVPDLPRVLPPVGVLPCDLQSSSGGAAAENAAVAKQESTEGLDIGDPLVVEYMHNLGYKAGPARPEDLFPDTESARRLRKLWSNR